VCQIYQLVDCISTYLWLSIDSRFCYLFWLSFSVIKVIVITVFKQILYHFTLWKCGSENHSWGVVFVYFSCNCRNSLECCFSKSFTTLLCESAVTYHYALWKPGCESHSRSLDSVLLRSLLSMFKGTYFLFYGDRRE
jgi:hypothetical protein